MVLRHLMRVLGSDRRDARNLTQEEAYRAFSSILGGGESEILVGSFLTALRWKGVTVEELTGFALAVMTLVGLINIIVRRLSNVKVKTVTTPADWFLYLLLLVQVLTGMGVAVFNGWGSSWFASSIVPWIWSLLIFNPDVSYVAAMPLLVKAHIVNAFLLIGFFPFTRLVHILVVPNPYLWRKTQVVLWNRDRKTINKA